MLKLTSVFDSDYLSFSLSFSLLHPESDFPQLVQDLLALDPWLEFELELEGEVELELEVELEVQLSNLESIPLSLSMFSAKIKQLYDIFSGF